MGAEFDIVLAETLKGTQIAYNTSTGNITGIFIDHGHGEPTLDGLPASQGHMQVDVVGGTLV